MFSHKFARETRREIMTNLTDKEADLVHTVAKNVMLEMMLEFPELQQRVILCIQALRNGTGTTLTHAKNLCEAARDTARQTNYDSMNAEELKALCQKDASCISDVIDHLTGRL